MTFSGRIRLFLIAAAVLPPLLIMLVIYFHFERQADHTDKRLAYESLTKYESFDRMFQQDLLAKISNLKESPELKKALVNVQSGRTGRLEIDPRSFGLDFLEIIDTANTVLATYHRPGLLDQKLELDERSGSPDTSYVGETVEYDLEGGHAAFVHYRPLNENIALYTGKYIDDEFLGQLALVVNAAVEVYMPAESYRDLSSMDQGALYDMDDKYLMLLSGGKEAGFYLVATFSVDSSKPVFVTLFGITGLVAIAAALIAITLGFYFTGRAKREIDNLVSATSRVADGDFSTPVMAYEEGEFSQLADSFSDMMLKLRQTQQQLATSEKIAAWQTVGRKIAHEIKNPLTPIAISVDDLRRSHGERHPEFDKVLDETTRTIKSELARLIKLLDEFVSFARMKAPEIREANAIQFIDDLQALYKADIDAGRVCVSNNSNSTTFTFDPDAIKQVLINLVKNGLEASSDSTVAVTITDNGGGLDITVEDTGPGFTEDKLADSFEPYVSSKKGGSGLGLVICHRIVHDHGGTMELYNKANKGAGVKLRLPLQSGGKGT